MAPGDETLDTLFQGTLSFFQGKEGYRCSLDAPLLAHFVSVKHRQRIIDLGTGNGVIALILAMLHPSVKVVGVEVQGKMVDRARRSVHLNRLESRVKVLQGDVRSANRIFPPESFDVAVCNPPYRAPRSGRTNPSQEKRLARHEIVGGIDEFIKAGKLLLRLGGTMAFVYPATRAVDLLFAMRQGGIEPKRLRLVHSYLGSAASLVLAEGVKGGRRGIQLLAPVVVYGRKGKYTSELRAILGTTT